MADKRISQLVDRGTVANNDVVPIVVSGATTTNKATISSIQTFMQGNLDLGVTSVGITLGSSGTDVSVTGSPITTSGNITINIPDASATARGLVNTGTQTLAGIKTFTSTIRSGVSIEMAQAGTALPTELKNINGTGLTSIGSNGFGFNNSNNVYFSGSNKGGGVLAFSNTGTQIYTLQNASGTLAFTSDITSALTGFVTLGTAQTITAQKTFTTSGSTDSVIISQGSGSGIALDVIKAGSGQAIRVQKTSGSGDAVTITGGRLSAEVGLFTSTLSTDTGGHFISLNANLGGATNRIESSARPLEIVTAGSAITLAAGGATPQFTLASSGAATFSQAGNPSLTLTGTDGAYTSQLFLNSSGGGTSKIIANGGTNTLVLGTNNVDRLSISSTGAATFSSSVTAGGARFTDTVPIIVVANSNASSATYGASQIFRQSNTIGNGVGISFGMFNSSNANTETSYLGTIITTNTAGAERGDLAFYTTDNGSVRNERMRITSGGALLVGGISSTVYSEKLLIQYAGTGNQGMVINQTVNAGPNDKIIFQNSNGIVGFIRTDGTVTTYNVTSDYRLKEDLQEIKGLEKVQAIKVYDYKWKADNRRMDGVLAHELAEVLPYAVTGEKDEQDENGNDKMQAVDYSKIVPILIKAIQELNQKIDKLTS